MSDYSGDDIVIEEMPQGCVITGNKGTVVISSIQDAVAVIASLQFMLEQMEDENDLQEM
jgi:hypothetical protein